MEPLARPGAWTGCVVFSTSLLPHCAPGLGVKEAHLRLSWDTPNHHEPTLHEPDVLFWSVCAVPFNGFTQRHGALGGSETEVVWCAEALAARGRRVVVATLAKDASELNGVLYLPANELGLTWKAKAKNLVVLRYVNTLPEIEHEKLLCWATDIPDGVYRPIVEELQARKGTLVCVSAWQREQFPVPGLERVVIPNGLPDSVYDRPRALKQPGRYVYASAAQKGLDATLKLWSVLRTTYPTKKQFSKNELLVCSPGYDKPDAAKDAPGVRVLGGLSFADLCGTIASAEGLFYVNTLPETFGIVLALAEALGTPAYMCGLNGLGGAEDTVAENTITRDPDRFVRMVVEGREMHDARDFRWSHVVDEWLEVLA